MNLLHITATHLRLEGGIPVVLNKLVSAQNRIQGVQSKVLSLTSDIKDIDSPYFIHIKKEQLEEYLTQNRPDAVIIHSFYYIQYNWVSKVLNKKNIPYFIEPHGSFGREALKKSQFKKWIANHFIFKRLIKGAKGFVFLNDQEKKQSIFITKNDIIIPNGIDISTIKSPLETTKEIKNKIYFIGRYDINHKGLDYFLEALKILDKEKYNLEVSLFGKGADEAIRYIEDAIKKFSYIKLYLNSSISGQEKDNLLEQNAPMILTSRYEGFPMTILEAWSYGNPCIVTPGTNVFSEIKENNLGWGTYLDPSQIANCIKDALKDYSQYKEDYIKRCKDYVCQHYDWEKIAYESCEKIRRVLGLIEK
ncbi:glycosyltransferase [Gallibacterium anatis]|uniref:glycosyltransferase n=1 Tax=Gallibacterium anatis TaxID=750 RepID=UPI00254E5825|nr:glycosyltransferase [Gallibacterium anatis]WIM85536.1 glycosyltransferase [Gallibacterium anatis]WKS96584.1 glycosyltransferase [Gallibacterium anatis]